MKRTRSVFAFSLFLTCCPFLLTFCLFKGVVCLNRFVPFRRIMAMDGQTCPAEHADVMMDLPSRTKCLLHCKEELSCQGVFVEHDMSRCIKCSVKNVTGTGSTSVGSMFYELQPDMMGGHEYRLVEKRRNWTDAKQYCVDLGGYLTSVKSLEEQMYLEQTILVNYPSGVWIGGRGNAGDASSFRWQDGTYISSGFEKWYGQHPVDSAGCECIRMTKTADYQWKCRNCSEIKASICKID